MYTYINKIDSLQSVYSTIVVKAMLIKRKFSFVKINLTNK